MKKTCSLRRWSEYRSTTVKFVELYKHNECFKLVELQESRLHNPPYLLPSDEASTTVRLPLLPDKLQLNLNTSTHDF